MANELKLRRGTDTEHATFVGANAELTVNTDHKSLHVHDGVTQGGYEVARVDLTNIDNSTFAAKAAAAGISGGTGGGGTGDGAPLDATYLTVSLNGTLTNERRLQAGLGITANDGGAGGGFTLAADFASTVPSNLGSAYVGVSNKVARADHIHSMPTATDVGAVPVARQVIAGTGLSGGGALSSNITLNLAAGLSNLSDLSIVNLTNGDSLLYNSATSKWENSQHTTKLTTKLNSSTVGVSNGIKTINFTGGATLVADGTDPSLVTLNVPASLTTSQVQDIVGALNTGSTQNGITVTYDSANGKINYQTKNFTITLQGDVQGTATVTNLGNVTINTVVGTDAVALGTDTTGYYVSTLATGTGLGLTNASSTAEGAAYTLNLDTNEAGFVEAMQDLVGTMVSGISQQLGIAVIYDDTNGKLNFNVNDPTITISGAVSGSATMTNLGNTTISTTLPNSSVTLGTHTTGNYVATMTAGTGITLTNGITGNNGAQWTVALDTGSANFAEGVQDVVGGMVTSNTSAGISVTYYDDPVVGVGKLNFDVNDFSITLAGPITGTATVTNLANTSITTSIAAGAVTLGTHTSGNYVATVSGGGGIQVTGAAGAGTGITLAIDAASTALAEAVQDIVGGMVTPSGSIGSQKGISVVYDDTGTGGTGGGKLSFDVNDFTITLSGALTGTATVTDLGNTTLNATLANDSITLGTHTVGNYVATVVGSGAGITVSGSGSETAAITISSNATAANTASTIVLRDSSGNFSAGTITAALTGNATTATSASQINGVSGSNFARIDATPQLGTLIIGSSTAGADQANSGVSIREIGQVGVAQSSYNYAPAVNFNWSGRTQATMAMHSDGTFHFRQTGYTGTQYSSIYCNVMNGTATAAQYADLAERYCSDMPYEPGTVVSYGGDKEITESTVADDQAVAGVISTAPGSMLNANAGTDETHPYVALVGRVPCKVIGKVKKGQMLTTSTTPGFAKASTAFTMGSIIGKALEDKTTTGQGIIEIAIQRH
jgi:hypothetical protein